ncbi:AAA family ATPase [Ruegeria arenilitoris]|uniref:AAA family ATPase n=1 Tax=Ruegeria arenilitoris TaxID=1173585 RepID=UPI00147B8656|nr:AAA family ATPase [Ruegeria arenilitoris]
MLELLSLDSFGEQVAILVGPNGAGKSNFLRKLALDLRQSRNLIVICNTAYDRFFGIRGMKRISTGRVAHSPKTVVKQALADTLDNDDGRFFQIAKVLEHCGYRERIGFKLKLKAQRNHLDRQALFELGQDSHDIDLAASFFERFRPDEILWVGDREVLVSYSQGREFASVLRLEKALRKTGFLSDIQLYLERKDGLLIELLRASSGELSLISSLLFLIANRDADPVILVDEPENSLHPNWQREYIDKLLAALEYRSATVVIATHAPLIVTGALANARDVISVFQVDHGNPKKIDLKNSELATESIEEVLWRAFDVITPASHYVSEELAGVLRRLEEGSIGSDGALARVDAMDEHSFDTQQRAFFEAVRALIKKVSVERERLGRNG